MCFQMRLGLLKLLQKVLLNLQAEQVPAVIGGVLKAEYLLVWASHQSGSVRELVIKVSTLVHFQTDFVYWQRWVQGERRGHHT